MKSFYSILKFSPNIVTEDSVAIGLLLFDKGNFRYFFSNRKKRIAQNLLSNSHVNLNFLVNQIKEKCEFINNSNTENELFERYNKLSELSYFNYLSNYSNGVLQFSKPNVLFEPVTDTSFEKLINLLFAEEQVKEKSKKHDKSSYVFEMVNRKLIEKVNKKVHTHYMFKPSVFPSIFFNYELDCIGLNGSLIGAKTLSFDKSLQALDKDISHYFTLISSLTRKYNKSLESNNFYLISEEPQSIESKEHKLWESVKYNELIAVVHPEESGEIAEAIIENKASRFLEEVE